MYLHTSSTIQKPQRYTLVQCSAAEVPPHSNRLIGGPIFIWQQSALWGRTEDAYTHILTSSKSMFFIYPKYDNGECLIFGILCEVDNSSIESYMSNWKCLVYIVVVLRNYTPRETIHQEKLAKFSHFDGRPILLDGFTITTPNASTPLDEI